MQLCTGDTNAELVAVILTVEPGTVDPFAVAVTVVLTVVVVVWG